MVIYEITAVVESSLVAAYEQYMADSHIPDVLATGRFSRAYLTRAAGTTNRYRVLYFADSQDALNDYLQTEAPALRADFLRHFPAGAGVELVRENWEALKEFEFQTS